MQMRPHDRSHQPSTARTARGLALALAAGVASLAPAAAFAAVVVSDDFTDRDLDNNGTTDDGNSQPVPAPSGIPWYPMDQTTSGSPRPTLTVGGANPALLIDTGGSNQETMGVFGSPITVGSAAGDYVRVEFDFTYQGTPPDGTASKIPPLRFGFFDADEATFPTPGGFGTQPGNYDDQQPGAIGDHGVWGRVEVGTLGNGSLTRIITENNTDSLMSGTDGVDSFAPASGTFTTINDTSTYHMMLSVTRNADGSVTYALDVNDSGTPITGTANAGDPGDLIVDTFDYFAISTTNDGDYKIDNLVVTDQSPVPEPGSLGLVALGLPLLVRRRR